MARKQTKRSKQQADLRRHMNTGPFQYAEVITTYAAGDVAALSDIDTPFRMNQNVFNESTEVNLRCILDCEHARSIVNGKMTASQFGYGVYDVRVFARPSTGAVNPDNSLSSLGYMKAHWYNPTPLRMDALRALKGVEIIDDLHAADSATSDGRSDANPLLATPLDVAALTATTSQIVPKKGNKIIRFGFSGATPLVVRNSSYGLDLNLDGDEDDTWEKQYYVLTGDATEYFGIFDRMENAVNPRTDAPGNPRLAVDEWAYPTHDEMVLGQSVSAAPLTWALQQDGSADYLMAEFRGIHAVGGLISLTMPQWLSEGSITNNDFDLVCHLSARKWVPLA